MDSPWTVRGWLYMVGPWCGCLDGRWTVRGAYMAGLWMIHDGLWTVHGQSMAVYGGSVVVLGAPMVGPWAVHGVPMDSP